MNFKDVYEELINGKKIRRKSWKEGNYVNLNNIKVLGKESLTAEDWEIVEEKERKKQWWEPEWHECFYIIGSNGEAEYDLYLSKTDKGKMTFGNCFQTKEKAEFMAEKLKVIYELEKFAYENNEEEIDWNNPIQTKHILIFNHKSHNLEIDVWSINQDNPFNVYFTSKDIGYKAIETIGEERIKKYYFGVR